MIALTWQDLLQRRLPAARAVRLTVGVFDGLHLGHRRLLSEVTGGPQGVDGVVITFSRSPVVVRAPHEFPGAILTLRQKLERMELLGVGAAVVIDFSDEMSNLSGEAFVRLLRENLTIQRIVVGQNFRFGKKRNSGNDDLKEMLTDTGIELLVTAPVLRGSAMVSSSRIRAAIRAGRLDEARDMLTVPHTIDLREVPGQAGRDGLARFSRSNIQQVLPPAGDYAATLGGPGGERAGTCRVEEDWLTLTEGTFSTGSIPPGHGAGVSTIAFS
ncbi:MAG TPA: FAD synthetase family protein [Spirochaetia bacterium]|nr:FAD synthetase family protein [Spirochaetia bacterium]